MKLFYRLILLCFLSITHQNNSLAAVNENDLGRVSGRLYGSAYVLSHFYKITNCTHQDQDKILEGTKRIILEALPKEIGNEFLVYIKANDAEILNNVKTGLLKVNKNTKLSATECNRVEDDLWRNLLLSVKGFAFIVNSDKLRRIMTDKDRDDVYSIAVSVCLRKQTDIYKIKADQGIIKRYCECSLTSLKNIAFDDMYYNVLYEKPPAHIENVILRDGYSCAKKLGLN